MLNMRAWKMRVYRSLFNAVQKYWTNERWIRVTDAEGQPQFVKINETVSVDPVTGMPMMRNAVGELDVDIILDEGPDSITLMQDTYDAISQALPAVAPMLSPAKASAVMDVLIETSPLAGRHQKEIPRRRPERGAAARSEDGGSQGQTRCFSSSRRKARHGDRAAKGATRRSRPSARSRRSKCRWSARRRRTKCRSRCSRPSRWRQLKRQQTEAEIMTGPMHEIDAQTTQFRNGLITRGQEGHRSAMQKQEEMLAGMMEALTRSHQDIGQMHQNVLAAVSKPRKAVIQRDPRTGKVVGAMSVSD